MLVELAGREKWSHSYAIKLGRVVECNTAAGGETGNAEALSGLARAFLYAGARSLLVSHWYVDSRAAVKLTTGAFAELKRRPLTKVR